MKDIKSLFNSTTFVIEYIILSLFMSYFVAWVQNHYRLNAIEWLNNKRKNENKCELAKTESLWTSLFLDGNDHLISVIKDKDKYATGIIKGIHRSNGEAKQLWLVGGQDFDFIVENFNEDIEAKGIYLDLDKNIKIIEYDLDKINSINNE